jgi:hypothetical protein
MKLNKKLNIVLPIERGHVHAVPISREIFNRYFITLSKTFSALYTENLSVTAGPRVAALLLKKVAQADGEWEGQDGVENGLMNEIIRLANVVLPTDQGWKSMPLYEAIRQNMLDEDEKAEVENSLVFFTCVSSMHKRTDLDVTLKMMVSLWGGQTTLLDSTEFANSLPTSTPDGSTGEREKASSIPS